MMGGRSRDETAWESGKSLSESIQNKSYTPHTVTPPVTLFNNSVQSVHQNTNYSVSKRYVVFFSSNVSPNNNTCKVVSI